MNLLFFNTKHRILLGFAVWLIWVILRQPAPLEPEWARGILLLAPLVVFPMGIDILLRSELFQDSQILGVVRKWAFLPAMLFVFAYLLKPGWLALVMALPWVVVTVMIAWIGASRILDTMWKEVSGFCLASGMVYLSMAGVWIVFDRTGFRPLDYDPEIVFLTIVHFHYAGFILPLVSGLAIRETGGTIGKIIGYMIVSGISLVAAGIVFSRLGFGPDWEGISAWWMAISGLAVAGMHLRLFFKKEISMKVRVLWAFAATMLAGGMLLAGLYGTRYLAPLSGLDIPAMRALHGTMNAVGFGLFATLGWWLNVSKKSPTNPEKSAIR